jgi:hypothetical protein
MVDRCIASCGVSSAWLRLQFSESLPLAGSARLPIRFLWYTGAHERDESQKIYESVRGHGSGGLAFA